MTTTETPQFDSTTSYSGYSMTHPEDAYTAIVARFLRIEDVTWGEPKKHFIVRYRGHLYNEDSAQAYDQLAATMRALNVTPLFRIEEGRHAIILISGTINPKPSRLVVNIILFVLTVLTVMFTGGMFSYEGNPTDIAGWVSFMVSGAPFAVSMMSILLAHELGHYLAGRFHKTAVTLPYFIPFPLSYFGTMGAFIQLKEPPRNRRIMLDIGIAGPIAGLLVAIPVLILGLALSPVEQIPFNLPPGQIFEGNSILYLLLKFLVHGQLLPQPFHYMGVHPVLYWIQYFFTATPVPRGGMDVSLHPIAWAGWAGLLVTALNLIPAGQLDGGHIIHVLLGRRAIKLLPYILVALALLGIVWNGWWLWALIIFFLGRFYAEPLDQITTLDPRRKAIAVLGVIIFILVFSPVPLV